MTVIPAYAALLALLFIALSIRTIRARRAHKVAIGTGGHAAVERAMRVHANFAEYVPLALLPRASCGVNEIDAALNRLALAVPIIKKNLLEACTRVVGADGVILEAEAELLRAVADTLDCPMPPLGIGE